MSVGKYQHLIEACGSNKEQMAELGLILTAHMMMLAAGCETAQEKQNAMPTYIAVRAALDELQRRVREAH